MQINKLYIIAGLIIALGLFYVLAAHADESNQATAVTFNQPVQIPGQLLPAGTYVFKLANRDTDQSVVQIFNAKQSTHRFRHAVEHNQAVHRADALHVRL